MTRLIVAKCQIIGVTPNSGRGVFMGKKRELPPCIILCGGEGTRLRDVTELLPKPMVPIGEHPVIWHIMKSYAAYGVRRFILCLGYKREVFITYFLNYSERSTDITINLGKNGNIEYHGIHDEDDWSVTLANTGGKTQTGGRVYRGAKYLNDNDEDFFLTYGDAVADLDIGDLYESHKKVDKAITVTSVHPAGRFGEMRLNGEDVIGFHEKPQTEKGLINGGFMVVKKSFLNKYLYDDPMAPFEGNPMSRAIKDGQMSAFVHEGFWQCMDTQREHTLLNDMWNSGKATWKVW